MSIRSHDTNILIGDDPSGWITGIKSYGEIVYKDVWDGIDLRYYLSQEGPKYEYIVQPYSDPTEISMVIGGHDGIALVDKWTLSIRTSDDVVIDGPLEVYYQGENDGRIGAQYSIVGHNEIRYAIDEYDRSRAIVIDPLIYSTMIGGTTTELSSSIGVDKDGNTYISGSTDSFDFFNTSTIGDLEHTIPGTYDVFVMKIDMSGAKILYSTIIGGKDSEFVNGLEVNTAGEVVLTGNTYSMDFPETSSPNTTIRGSSDIFICRLSEDGANLSFSMIVGGSRTDIANDLAIYAGGDIFVAGYSHSEDIPITSGAYMGHHGSGNADAYVLRISQDGSTVRSSTAFGGEGPDIGYGIDVDRDGHVYICGVTGSSDLPTTPSAFNTEYRSGFSNIFVAKFSSNLSTLDYSTFVDASTREMRTYIEVDERGSAFLAGSTDSNDFPTTNGAFQRDRKGDFDAYLCKINENGSSLLYSSYVGGEATEILTGLRVDQQGYAYITGTSHSFDFPVTSGNLREDNDVVNGDVFICKMVPKGTSLSYASFFGGSRTDYSTGIDLSSQGDVLIIGSTNSPDLPVTFRDSQQLGGTDTFVMKFSPDASFSPIVLEHGPVLYAKYRYYKFVLMGNPSRRDSLPDRIELVIDPEQVNISIAWELVTDFDIISENDPLDQIMAQSSRSIKGNDIFLECEILINWTWPHEDPCDVRLEMSWNSPDAHEVFTRKDLFRVENDLDITGNPQVSGGWQGGLIEGEWVRSGEEVTMSGLVVTYEDAEGVYPPDGTCMVNLSISGGQWTLDPLVGGVPIVITIGMVDDNLLNEILTLRLDQLPGTAECNDTISFALNVDGDLPTLMDPTPESGVWHSDRSILFSIIAMDDESGVDVSTLEYSFSTIGPDSFGPWMSDGIDTYGNESTLEAIVSVRLDEGRENYFRWRILDNVGNGYVVSEVIQIMIDSTSILFTGPYPSTGIWYNYTDFIHGCNISDINGSGVDVSTIQYRIAHGTPSHYSDWTSWDVSSPDVVEQTEVSLAIVLKGSPLNFVQWRAKDAVSSEYINSPNYEYKIDILPPILAMITPDLKDRMTETEVKIIAYFNDSDSGLSDEFRFRYMSHGSGEFSKWIVSRSVTDDGGYYVDLNLTRGDRNRIQFMAFDNAGNANISEISTISINRIPVPVITHPKSDASYIETDSINLDGTLTYDEDGDLLVFKWYIDNFDEPILTLDNGNITLRPGYYKVILVVSDAFNGTNQTHVFIYVDEPPPTYSFIEDYWLFLLLVISITIVLVFVYHLKRTRESDFTID